MYVRAAKRATALLALAMLTVGLAAGCGDGDENPRPKGEQTAPVGGFPVDPRKAEAKDDDDDGGWFFLLATGTCMLAVGAVAGAAGAMFLRGRAPAPAQPVAAGPPPADSGASQALADRAALVSLLIRLDSRLDNPAIQQQVSAGLAKAGVEVIDVAEGTRFDALKHQAGGAAYTDDETKHMTISATEQRGYTDRGKVLSLPIVTIYTYPGA
jgi:hypothetical protein